MASVSTLKSKLSVNLLHPQGVPQKLPVKFLKWLLSYGRFIAIVVELIVILTFVVRFKLDSDLNSIKDNINNQLPIIKNSAPLEADIRQTQFKLDTIKTVYNHTPQWQLLLRDIADQIPGGVKLRSISLQHNTNSTGVAFQINGSSSSNSDLAVFLNGMRQSSAFIDPTLTSITFESGQLVFTIAGGLQ